MAEHVVAAEDEIGPGERAIVDVEGVEIAVFNVDGDYRAVVNWCPHQGGPLCEGDLGGRVSASFDRESLETTVTWDGDGETIACPWHGWEFDVASGECLSRAGSDVPTYDVWTRDGEVVVET